MNHKADKEAARLRDLSDEDLVAEAVRIDMDHAQWRYRVEARLIRIEEKLERLLGKEPL